MPLPPPFILMAFVDAFNVCTISLLALLISLLFTMNASRTSVFVGGLTFLTGLFIAYFTAGLGIMLLALSIPTVPHFLARIAVAVMVFFGAANVINYFRPGLIPTMIPNSLGRSAIASMKAGGLTSVGFAGVLAGLHNFPCACTGGIYMAFVGMIASDTYRVLYLFAYNVLFIMPLLSILVVLSSKPVTLRFRKWHQENKQMAKLVMGVIMMTVGAIILAVILFA